MPRGSKAESLAEFLAELPDELRRRAFTHASWVEHRSDSYERLAFLGDVVLSLAVSTHLYPRFERHGAGRLTKVRAQAVSGASCARVAQGLGVPESLRAAAPEGTTGRSAEMLVASERVLASICEAIIGAAYLAFGFDRTARRRRVVPAEIEEALEHPVDYKSVLQERLARAPRSSPTRPSPRTGPAHDRSFIAVAQVDGQELGRGEGKTKKARSRKPRCRLWIALEEVAP